MPVPGSPDAATVALWMAANLGWHVLPLHPHKKSVLGNCRTCHKDDHHATVCPCLARGDGALCHGVWAATNAPDVIRRWARARLSPVWGLSLGASGLLGFDLDAHGGTAPAQPLHGLDWPTSTPLPVDGVECYATLAALHGAGLDTDATLTVATPSGGLHLIYAAEVGRWKSSSVGKSIRDGRVRSGLAWQVDIKAHAGYVVIPGSRTPSGLYERVSSTTTPDALAPWQIERLVATGHDRHATPAKPPAVSATPVAIRSDRAGRYAASALRSACVELAGMSPNSGRNAKLFRSASRLAGMVEAGWIDADTVQAALAEAARAARLPAGEIRYALASGMRSPWPAPDLEAAA
ncbi:bifunctional DNA primase/polymerase [Allokutzneria oryzae]|uniref:Bifunctional DNA primase/polymerase n=1 Tax=Allokutzneria oryzae TaxID=1378989 RepID=A0ABV5ZZF9_9PSEU